MSTNYPSHQKIVTSLALSTFALLAACSKPNTVTEPIRPVILHTVSSQALADKDAYSGEIRARYETDLAFRIGGKLIERNVDAGAAVKKGQTLARLDPQDARLAAESARAQVASAQSELALTKAELDRSADLLNKKFISQSAFDARQNAFNAAKSRVDQVRASSAVQANQSVYTTLIADADGIVTQVAAEPGQVVNVGQTVMRLARAGNKEVLVNVAESQLSLFKVGQPVTVFLWTDQTQRFPGVIREIAGGADAATRTYAVRVSLDNPPETARLGMTANVLLVRPSAANTVLLPFGAIDKRGEKPVVWIFDNVKKTVNPKTIEIGQLREDGVLVNNGVAAGDVLVAAGTHKLVAGQAVRVYGEATASNTKDTPAAGKPVITQDTAPTAPAPVAPAAANKMPAV
jgi:membrane fusion protein, multidrug efflux system